MIQVHTCVSVHCDQCGDSLGSPDFESHYTTEMTALDAAAERGWLVDPGGRVYCSACGPVLTCEAEGHEFTQWRLLLVDERQEPLPHPDKAAATANEQPVGREYRDCRRCCLHESRPATWLISESSGWGKSVALPFKPLAAGTDVVGEVA